MNKEVLKVRRRKAVVQFENPSQICTLSGYYSNFMKLQCTPSCDCTYGTTTYVIFSIT